jgi:uncharacterized membrane protein (DUF373 family)
VEDVVIDGGRDDTPGEKTGRPGQGQPEEAGHAHRLAHQGPHVEGSEPHTVVHALLRGLLEGVQDLIVLGLCSVLFLIMARALWDLGQGALSPHVDVRNLLSQVLFVTLLVELYRLLVVYLREHRVAVDFVVEIALVSALREVVLRGVTDLAWERLLAVTAFVLALGALLRFGTVRVPERKRAGQSMLAWWPWGVKR